MPKSIIKARLSLLLGTMLMLISQSGQAIDLSSSSLISMKLQAHQLELDFAGESRKTRFYSIDMGIGEQLTTRLDGAILFGYTLTDQASNPIEAGQDTKGGYAGLTLNLTLFDSPYYQLSTRASYRYIETEASLGDQDIQWKWHEAQLDLKNRIHISKSLYMEFGVSGYWLDGREKATGNLDQNTDFEAKDSVYGHFSLQFDLDHTGQIIVGLDMGSIEGGQITFLRQF